jgi:SAM-dependent methyltransferase
MQPSEYARIFALEQTHWWYCGVHELVESMVRARGRRDLRILDAGCGTGGLLARLQQYGAATGCDYADAAVAFCRQRGLTVTQANLNTWTPPAGQYDVIVSVDVLYHEAIDDDAAVVQRLATGLCRGGLLMLHLPALESLRRQHDIAVATKRRYTRGDIRAMVTAAGLRPCLLSYRLPWLACVALAQKGWEALQRTGATAQSDLRPTTGWINSMLRAVVRAENALVRRGLPMPVGTSVFCVAERP